MTTLCIPQLPRIFRNLYQIKFPPIEQEERKREKEAEEETKLEDLAFWMAPRSPQ